MPFEFKNIGYITSNEITEFILKNEKSYNFGDVNDDELIGFNEKSKVYECYIKNRLVGFIILQYMYLNECEYEYEIHIGKLVNDRRVKFKMLYTLSLSGFSFFTTAEIFSSFGEIAKNFSLTDGYFPFMK